MQTYETNVFINCPFDNNYLPLLRPLLFTVLFHRYEPRIALESSDSGKLRLEKIKDLINASRYSIHDLSRMQAAKAKEVYRMNLPFELGIDFGYRCIGANHSRKRFLILEKEKHRYTQAISDINGLDIKYHSNKPLEIVRAVRNWFVETVGFKNAQTPTVIWHEFTDFYAELYDDKAQEFEKYDEKLLIHDIDFMPIPELIDKIKSWLK